MKHRLVDVKLDPKDCAHLSVLLSAHDHLEDCSDCLPDLGPWTNIGTGCAGVFADWLNIDLCERHWAMRAKQLLSWEMQNHSDLPPKTDHVHEVGSLMFASSCCTCGSFIRVIHADQ